MAEGGKVLDTNATVAGLDGHAEELIFPRLCEGLLVLPIDDGLLIEGGPRRKLVRGADVSALTLLLSLLDGQHAVPGLAAELGWALSEVQAVISLLSASGLVEHGTSDTASSGLAVPSHVSAFLSRQINVTGRHPNANSAVTALADASVLLIAPEYVAGAVKEDLSDVAVGHLAWHADPRAITEIDVRAVAAAGHRAVAVMLDDSGTAGSFGAMEGWCRTHGMPLLRFAIFPGKIEVGPLFYEDFTACYVCFSRGYQELNWAEIVPAVGEQDRNEHCADLAAGLVTQEILAIVGQLTWPISYRAMTVTPTVTLGQRRFAVTPYPECVACGSGRPAGNRAEELTVAFEWVIQEPPSELCPAGGAMDSRKPAIPGLETQRPTFPTCPRRLLPPPETIAPPPGTLCGGQVQWRAIRPHSHLSEAIIAGILLYAAGRHVQDSDPGSNRRWTPSAGNLGSTEIYALCRPGQFGNFPGTIFRYDDLSHEMIALRSDSPGLDECLAGTPLAGNIPLMALVLVGATSRICQKYGPFGYRLVHLDAGCAAFQLAAVASSYGLEVSFAEPPGEALANLLELYPGGEEITAVVGIYPSKGRDATN
jgi:SagB-type dehydrogenase family enzyme